MRHDHYNIADEYENKYFNIFNNILNFNLCIDSCFWILLCLQRDSNPQHLIRKRLLNHLAKLAYVCCIAGIFVSKPSVKT